MKGPTLRMSQLITTWGPGAMVDLPDEAVVIAGTDFWTYNKAVELPVVHESRLERKVARLLDVPHVTLRTPPAAIEVKGYTAKIRAYRFPRWYVVQRVEEHRGFQRRRLVPEGDVQGGKALVDGKKWKVVPVRFVRACAHGHLGDIDWYAFVHGQDVMCRRELYVEERGITGDLGSIWITCACGAEIQIKKAVAAAPTRPGEKSHPSRLGWCDGARPWLRDRDPDGCDQPARLLIRSASNAWFPEQLSVISIPDTLNEVETAVSVYYEKYLSAFDSIDDVEFALKKMPALREHFAGFAAADIMEAIERLRTGISASTDIPVKDVEFDAFTRTETEMGSDQPFGDFYARTLPRVHWDKPWMQGVARVVLVHRLREVIALTGFTRLESTGPDTTGELSVDVTRAPLARFTEWVPAYENRGEGIFLQFDAVAVHAWRERDAVKQRAVLLRRGFDAWAADHATSARTWPGVTYHMLHSLSHLLLTAIALECGYPASSLRERVYAGEGRYGILIYTSSPDAEGTLGGLVMESRSIAGYMQRALQLAQLCSNDPVCALHEPEPHTHQLLHGAACHGCLLISENSCEQRNDYLDRALVIPTLMTPGAAMFSLES